MHLPFKKQWRILKAAPVGRRFRQRYESRRKAGRSTLAKVLFLAAGFVLFAAGIVLLPLPGPGLIVMLIGAALMAEESYFAAWALDWVEVRLRRLWGAVRRS